MGALNMTSIEYSNSFKTLAGIEAVSSRPGVVCFNHLTNVLTYINQYECAIKIDTVKRISATHMFIGKQTLNVW